jgi:hypothetical protein
MNSYRRVAGTTSGVTSLDGANACVEHAYDPPVLLSIGDASAVILGLPGGGADGPYGMTEPLFEFAEDGEP